VPYNVPTVTTNDISFGPAVLYMGVAGATPTTDVGSITEDGVAVEVTSEKRTITQGNPKIALYTFTQAQAVMAKVTGIEWNFDRFADALGAGNTTVSGAAETFSWGGDPIVTRLAMHIEHYMAVTGNTMNVYLWEVVSESGLSLPFGHDEHSFEYSYQAQRVTTDWNSVALPATEQLMRVDRTL